jgi:hypothetical protein
MISNVELALAHRAAFEAHLKDRAMALHEDVRLLVPATREYGIARARMLVAALRRAKLVDRGDDVRVEHAGLAWQVTVPGCDAARAAAVRAEYKRFMTEAREGGSRWSPPDQSWRPRGRHRRPPT